jgi:stage V sporulation protein G
VEITEIRVTLRNEDKLKAFVNITFDNQFVVRGLKIINGKAGYFVSMPSRRMPHGKYQDVAHPINSEARRDLEGKVLAAYEEALQGSEEVVQQESWDT